MTADTIPDRLGFDTRYGVRLAEIGEEGDIVIFGHVDPRRALAAIRAHLRRYLNNDYAEVAEVMAAHRPVARGYAVQVTHCPDYPRCGGDDCPGPTCREIAECVWYLDGDVDPATPGAFPITYWSA